MNSPLIIRTIARGHAETHSSCDEARKALFALAPKTDNVPGEWIGYAGRVNVQCADQVMDFELYISQDFMHTPESIRRALQLNTFNWQARLVSASGPIVPGRTLRPAQALGLFSRIDAGTFHRAVAELSALVCAYSVQPDGLAERYCWNASIAARLLRISLPRTESGTMRVRWDTTHAEMKLTLHADGWRVSLGDNEGALTQQSVDDVFDSFDRNDFEGAWHKVETHLGLMPLPLRHTVYVDGRLVGRFHSAVEALASIGEPTLDAAERKSWVVGLRDNYHQFCTVVSKVYCHCTRSDEPKGGWQIRDRGYWNSFARSHEDMMKLCMEIDETSVGEAIRTCEDYWGRQLID